MRQRVPDWVLSGIAVIALGLGGAWWMAHAPAPAIADPGVSAANRLVPSIGGAFVVHRRSEHRRCLVGEVAFPGLRSVEQDSSHRC